MFNDIIIPAIIIFLANVFGREPGSNRYEQITAMFGWLSGASLLSWLVLDILSFYFALRGSFSDNILNLKKISLQIFILCLTTVLSRIYEELLKPNADGIESVISRIIYKAKSFLKEILKL